MEQVTKRREVVEGQSIDVGIQEREEVCGKTPTEKVVIHTGGKVYRTPLPSVYREIKLS